MELNNELIYLIQNNLIHKFRGKYCLNSDSIIILVCDFDITLSQKQNYNFYL